MVLLRGVGDGVALLVADDPTDGWSSFVAAAAVECLSFLDRILGDGLDRRRLDESGMPPARILSWKITHEGL